MHNHIKTAGVYQISYTEFKARMRNHQLIGIGSHGNVAIYVTYYYLTYYRPCHV